MRKFFIKGASVRSVSESVRSVYARSAGMRNDGRK